MFQSPAAQSANTDVFITHELKTRIPRKADYLQENLALQELAARMADDPEEILPRFVDLALEATGAVTGALSLYEEAPAPGVFRWHCLRGTLASFDGATTPRQFSPCGITLDQRAPVLARNPEQIYHWLVDAGVSLPEVLLVPLYIGSTTPLGTLWVVSEKNGHFDGADARVLTELASFVSIALRMVRAEEQLRRALQDQEMLTGEMNHRVQNLFAIVDGLIRLSRQGAGTVDEMADGLSGRLHALRSAHGLIRNSSTAPAVAGSGSDLGALIGAIVLPHDEAAGDVRRGFLSRGRLSNAAHAPLRPWRSYSTN